MATRHPQSKSLLVSFNPHAQRLELSRADATERHFGDEILLKVLIIAIFLPEGLSFFIGDYRFSPARAFLIIVSLVVLARVSRRASMPRSVCVPSDIIAPLAGLWMVVAAIATDGITSGFKGGIAQALEFSGTYYAFRYLLGPIDSSVRLVAFLSKIIVLVVLIALLDPLSGQLFTYEFVKGLTGYVKMAYETAKASHSEAIYRDGLVRAMGPLEHSILFGTVCAWFGALALFTFPGRLLRWTVATVAIVGLWFSQSRGPLLGLVIACALAALYAATRQFGARWKVLGLLVALAVTTIFLFSGSPIATLMTVGGLSPEAAWYRQAVWNAALPLVWGSPFFGIGLTEDWDWQVNGALIGTSVDAFWLRTAMMFGIPGSLFIFLTMAGAFWLGPIDNADNLSREERLLSVALGVVVTVATFLGFTVHFWGVCWILLGAFPGIRANLAECAIVRHRHAFDELGTAAPLRQISTWLPMR